MKDHKTVLVTGASGFIGSWVVKKIYKDLRVVAVVSPFSVSNRLDDIKKNIEVVKIDLSKTVEVEKIFNKSKPNYVLHLATHGVYQYQQTDEDRISIDNYSMTFNLLNASKKCGIEKFVNTGSVFEYGSQNRKVKENDVFLNDILNQYSATKIATTVLTNSFTSDLQVITLRPFTTYGPTEDASRFVYLTIKRALAHEDIKLVKGIVRDFVYVEDVADAYIKAIENDYKSGEIVNIASGKKYSLELAARLIKKITNSKSKIIFDDSYKRKKGFFLLG